jgi:glycine/D-amino acid oxidase-like deaminating enzyme
MVHLATVQSLPREADVVVIGGGIVGCGAAFHLARRGFSVLLLEKGVIAGEQSSRNWGWVRQNGRNLRELPLGIASRKLWEQMSTDVEADVGWVQSGNIDLAYDHDEMALFERWRRRAHELGLDTELLDRGEVMEHVPGIAGGFVGGIYSPTDGQADPHRVTAAIAEAARARGAELVERCAVEAVEVENGAVSCVRTDRGDVRTAMVVLAAGAWSTRLLWRLSIRLPQRPIRNTVLATTPVEPLTRTVVWAEGVAFRQDHTGRFILSGGGTSDTDVGLDMARFFPQFMRPLWDARRRGEIALRFDRTTLVDLATSLPWFPDRDHPWKVVRNREPRVNLRNAWKTLQNFRATMPNLSPIGMERVWAGYIDYTPDAVPVIDRLQSPSGLVITTGFSGHGFALGPIGGLLAAQLAAGETPELDTHPFRLSRFAEKDTHERELHF